MSEYNISSELMKTWYERSTGNRAVMVIGVEQTDSNTLRTHTSIMGSPEALYNFIRIMLDKQADEDSLISLIKEAISDHVRASMKMKNETKI